MIVTNLMTVLQTMNGNMLLQLLVEYPTALTDLSGMIRKWLLPNSNQAI
jgi:hypothetical protein